MQIIKIFVIVIFYIHINCSHILMKWLKMVISSQPAAIFLFIFFVTILIFLLRYIHHAKQHQIALVFLFSSRRLMSMIARDTVCMLNETNLHSRQLSNWSFVLRASTTASLLTTQGALPLRSSLVSKCLTVEMDQVEGTLA